MRKSVLFLISAAGLLIFLIVFAIHAMASNDAVKMVGEITAIDSMHKTVVIEVPVGKDVFGKQLFTVGGPLSHDAQLKRGGRSATLEDFKVGDQVTVVWTTIETGHRILSLETP